jgi:hypothetical protein
MPPQAHVQLPRRRHLQAPFLIFYAVSMRNQSVNLWTAGLPFLPMPSLTVNEPKPGICRDSAGYAGIIADVRHLTDELQLAVDAARRCVPGQETTVLVDLHNRARGIAAWLNQALAIRHQAEDC